MVVDAGPMAINIKVLAEAHALIDYLKSLDSYTGDWYDLYPSGQTGYCHAGSVCWINLRIRNNGTASGNIYVKVTVNGSVIFNQSYPIAVGQYVDISNPAPNFVMPAVDTDVIFEIGH